ncbi:MAG: polymer-forming cytoskeletal protein [Verrucomicrobia bacterium]|nr:polymer-forming cytoskeletal protein [Verrucomicrobiota bacterium]MBU1909224.1 polymer-forming cytoskeletal protein [Verrucomicrobiota bacterium]
MENNASTPQSVIAAEVEITGTVKTSGSIRIDGKLDGELNCGGDAVIGKSATIKGNLTVSTASIAGAITGNVTARDRIEMKSSARVMGDIKAKRLAVEDGVTFVGKSEVNPSATPSAAAPASQEEEPAAEAKPGFFAKR